MYESGELEKEATVSIMETVQNEGDREVKRTMEYYNLDAIIAVGYRVNSKKATQFRIWATQSTLLQFHQKGLPPYNNRMENNNNLAPWRPLPGAFSLPAHQKISVNFGRGLIFARGQKRFEVIFSEGMMDKIRVIRDTVTGVHYLHTTNGFTGGLTVLLDEYGKPVIDKNKS